MELPKNSQNVLNDIRLLRLAKSLGVDIEEGLNSSFPQKAHSERIASEIKIERGQAREEFILESLSRGTPWKDLEPLIFDYAQNTPNDEVRAKLCEFAFIYASTEDLLKVLTRFLRFSSRFYFLLEKNLRTYLLLKLWVEGKAPIFNEYFLKTEDALTELEMLYVFYLKANESFVVEAFTYFRAYELELFKAIKQHGRALGITSGSLAITAFEMALKLEDSVKAEALLDSIAKDDPAFKEASDLFLRLSLDSNSQGKTPLEQKLAEANDDIGKLRVIYQHLVRLKRADSLKDRNRPALNVFFKDPLKHLSLTPATLASLAQMLSEQQELQKVLPDFFALPKEHALRFLPNDLEKALWSPFIQSNNDPFCFVAYVHLYIAQETMNDQLLWKAYDAYINYVKDHKPEVLWAELLRATISHTKKYPGFSEPERRQRLLRLQLAHFDRSLTASDISQYLKEATTHSYYVLDRLDQYVKSYDDDLAWQVLQKKGQVFHYTNKDLERLYSLSAQQGKYEQALRICTILKSRMSLNHNITQAWAISGEKRDELLKNNVTLTEFLKLYFDFDKTEQRIIESLAIMGPKILKLRSLVDPHCKTQKASKATKTSAVAIASQQGGLLLFLKESDKTYLFEGDSQQSFEGICVPSFLSVMPQNLFSVTLLKVMELFGMHAYDFNLKLLMHFMRDWIPTSSTVIQDRYASKIGRWLKELTPEERLSWYDLPRLIAQLSDERAYDLLLLMAMRTAILLDQNFYQMLLTLKAMRAPLSVIWSMEGFILSNEFFALRERLGHKHHYILPESMRRLTKLCPEDK